MTIRVRVTLLVLVSAALVFSSSSSTIRAQDDVPWLWTGDVELTDLRVTGGGPVGTVRHQLTARLQLREAGRIPVFTTTSGRARKTGEFVRLVDAGSRGAKALNQGSWVWDRGTEHHKYTFSGASEPPLTAAYGWIYYSVEDDDPVKAALPNGAYALWVEATSTNLQVKHDWRNVTTRGTFTGTRTSRVQDVPLGLWTGGAHFWTEAPTGIPAALDSSIIIANVAMARARSDVPGYDERDFALRDGVMMSDVLFDRPLAAPQQGKQSARWQLRRARDIRATVTPVDPAWRPKRHEPVTVTARLDPALGLEGRFRFVLRDVSRHPGYATNAGGNDSSPDMKFAVGQAGFSAASEDHATWVIETTATDLTEATVRIEPLDYGASATLTAEVQIDGVWHACMAEAGEDIVQLPRDADRNSIADAFDASWGTGGTPANTDDDAHPAGAGKGDGFTSFEEYRGFIVMGAWEPTIPTIKDLFVRDTFAIGDALFGLTGVRTHFIDEAEFDAASRIVNVHQTAHALGAQHALTLEHGDARWPGELGYVDPDVGLPADVKHVYVDVFSHYALGDAMDATLLDTVAHELGHAVNMHHHGDWEAGTCGAPGLVAPWRGAQAGDEACVMRYDGADYYKDKMGRCYRWTWPLAPGTGFCVSNQGTGINAGVARLSPDGSPMPVSGNAMRGNCMGQILLVRR